MFTLDSNILIAYLNDDPLVVNQLLKWRRENARFFISVISEVEIFALPKLNKNELLAIEAFIREFTVIPLDSQLGKIAAELRRNYKLSLGDSVIVATAKLTNTKLVTLDQGILKKVRRVILIQDL